jgi:transposase
VVVGVGDGRGVMMRPTGELQVYLHREPIDMRKGRNGLAALVRAPMATQNPPLVATSNSST